MSEDLYEPGESPSPWAKVSNMTFDLRDVAARRKIPRSQLEEVFDAEVFIDMTAEDVAVEVRKRVTVSQPVETYHLVTWPKTWWQHFKLDVITKLTANPITPLGRWLDRWAWRIERDKWERTDVVHQKVCPHLHAPDRDHAFWLMQTLGHVEE